jgi:hypothetical protein
LGLQQGYTINRDWMDSCAILRNSGEFTIFEFNGQVIRFVTSSRLERYKKVVEWNHGYLVVIAKYNIKQRSLTGSFVSSN